MTNRHYSDYFTTIYDEAAPVGHLGRGAHYSVMRYASWHDVDCSCLDRPQTHDFAVIWDEDHDTRIFYAIEKILQAGLLAPIQFIGERKAFLSVVVASRFYYTGSQTDQVDYENALQKIASDVDGDHWNLQIGFFDKAGPDHQTQMPGMIACDDAAEDVYLRNIDNLWKLGTKVFEAKPRSLSPRPSLPVPPKAQQS